MAVVKLTIIMIYDDLILRKKETKFGVLLILNRPSNLLATLRGLLVNTEPYLDLPTQRDFVVAVMCRYILPTYIKIKVIILYEH